MRRGKQITADTLMYKYTSQLKEITVIIISGQLTEINPEDNAGVKPRSERINDPGGGGA